MLIQIIIVLLLILVNGVFSASEIAFLSVNKLELKSKVKSKNKLNAGGNFTDYTWERFDRDLNANLNMLISGFVDGKLIYILEFPFSNQSFINKLQLQLNKKFPNRQRNKNDYLRSANFDFKDFMFNENNEKNNNFKINFLLTKQELENYKNYFNKKFFDELLKYAK